MTNHRWVVGAVAVLLACSSVGGCGRGSDRELEERRGWAPLPPGDGPTLADTVEELRAQAVSFDVSTEVGALSGRSGVTPTGQAVYSIPLDVAPGVGGMTPELSLEYRSTAQNGPLGVGFSLGGIAAAIRRCDRTLAVDGVTERFSFALDDALCWGGERLVLEDGEHGQDGAEYRTRHDPFAKIVQHGDASSRDGFFEVFTKDGRILTFGQPEAVLVKTVDEQSIPWVWALRKAEDRFDNEIEYRYDAPVEAGAVDPYALELREIAYGGTGSEQSRRHVRLEYEGRPDESWGYVAGIRQGRMRRIASIVAEGPQAQVVARYELDYEQDPVSGHSRVQAVRKCDAAGACLPATVLEWSDPEGSLKLDVVPYGTFLGPDAELVDDPIPFVSSPTRLVGDFDGDGDHDLLYFTDAGWRAWDGASQYDLLDTLVTLPWPVVLPEGDAYVEGIIEEGVPVEPDPAMPIEELAQAERDAAAAAYLDRLQPGFSISVVEANNDLRDDLVIPQRPLDGDEVDAWGYRFAQDVRVAVASTPEGEQPAAGFTEPVAFVDEAAGLDAAPIYSVTPLDHDGDGLSDLWLCQGEGYKSGHWVLARREPSDVSGQYVYTPYDSGVGCSVHDELLVTSLRGGQQDLLVVPAYTTGPGMPTPDDFDSPEAYHDDYAPLPEGQRTEYLALSFEPGAGAGTLEPTGLPRDHYQRWHDRLCRNGLARPYFGRPLASAGLGLDKLLDVNGDGLVDVVRFELESGDDPGNHEIVLGLDGIEHWDEGLSCSNAVEADIPARMRAYVNTGDGFIPGPVLHDFPGNPHANLWLNFQRAQLYDFDLDGILDLLLPGSGPDVEWTAVVSEGDGTYIDLPQDLPSGWPAYTKDDGWRQQFDKALRTQVMTLAPTVEERAQITFLGYVEDNPAGWPYLINTYATNYSAPHNRITKITDGLGAVVELGYAHVSPGGAHGITGMHHYPRTGPKGAMAVVSRHAVQQSPQGDFEVERYAYHDGVVDGWGQGFLGFAEVERWTEGNVDEHTWIHFEFDRDAVLADYPTAGRPTEILEQRRTLREDGASEYWLTRTQQTYETVTEDRRGGLTVFTYPSRQDIEVFVRETSCVVDCEPAPSDQFQSLVVEQERDHLGTVLSTTTTNGAETRTYEVTSLYDDQDAWIVGRAEAWTETSCAGGECGQRSYEATFDPTTGAVLTSTFAPDDAVARLDTEHVYDAHGNVTTTTAQNQQGDVRTTLTTWDAEGVDPESMTNAEGHTSWVIHHPATGVPVAEVAADGVTWVHSYDGFLRPTRHERRATPLGLSDGNVTTLAYELGGPVHDDTLPTDSALRVRTTAPGGQRVTVDYAATMQPMQRAWWGMQALDEVPDNAVGPGGEVYTSTLYDAHGRVVQESLPTWAPNQPAGYTTTHYDGLSRVVEVDRPNHAVDRFAYGTLSHGLETAHTDDRGAITRTQTDDAARVAVTIDAHGTRTCFSYGPFGVLRQVHRDCADPASPWVSTFSPDVAGRILAETDPAFGTRRYDYDGFGQVREVTADDGTAVTYTYDGLGRVEVRHDADGDTVHTYDLVRPGYLHSSESPDGIVTNYGYDPSGRLESVALVDLLLTVPGALEVRYEYGVGDRLRALVYPSVDGEPDVRIDYHYDGVGNLRRVERAGGPLVWSALAANEAGQLTHERFGNGLDTVRTYEPLTGRPADIETHGSSQVQHLAYGWLSEGELDYRTDLLHGQSETFEHDDLRRLTKATITRGPESSIVDVSYDAVGNILTKTGVGSYAYEDGRLLAYGTEIPVLLGHDDRGNITSHGDQTLTYTPFDKLRQLTDGGETLDFRYDAEGDRFSRSSLLDDELIVDVRGLYERREEDGKLELRYRVPAGGRIVAQIVRTPGPAGTWLDEVESLHDDHLGSTHVVTDESGEVVHTVAYDPWGQARTGDNWLDPLAPEALEDLGVGFTGHPARLDADLVDMGGRSYHPHLGRFFSPDPLVVSPLDAQAYNRYAYVLNRPLLFTDPTGYATQDGLGNDQGGGKVEDLPYHCDDGQECQRSVTVPDPDGQSALDAWNRALSFFESENGPGQGGPGFGGSGFGGGYPFGPNGVRHGNDHGQPGGSPAFTIAVTEDMCAQIAACSGRQSKKGPVYIWHAPVDDWAETAVDIATDFVPGVSHAKTAYDAYERIQNGEDPLEVLTAAGGDALLGLIPGGRPAKKVGKALGKAFDKAEDVADAAGDVAEAAKTRARRNGHLAGKEHPESGIPFDSNGYPDFSSVSRKDVKIDFSGSRRTDAKRANEAAGFDETPKGYVWHHHQDGTTMQLIPRDKHVKSGHDGGFSGR